LLHYIIIIIIIIIRRRRNKLYIYIALKENKIATKEKEEEIKLL
jgi:hypothetical protein